jgi:hypothetical protein
MRPRRVPATAVFSAALLVLCGAASALGQQAAPPATFTEYRQNIRAATARFDELAIADDDAEASPRVENDVAEIRAAREVRRLLPAVAAVQWKGETLEVRNEWLHAALDEYERGARPGANPEERAEAASQIAERLRALDERLGEAESGAGDASQMRDKEAEKGRLAAILRNPEFNKQSSRGGALAKLLEQIIQWIRDLLPNVGPLKPGASPGISRAAQIFIFALALGIVAYLVRKRWLRRGGRWKTATIREARVVLGEHLAPDQTPADLLAEAERLARAGELRGAIRKAYVALLCELGDRKIIRLAQHMTNRDYLHAVRSLAQQPQLYQEMQPLTANFERHWYGFEQATETDWTDFRTRCRLILGIK